MHTGDRGVSHLDLGILSSFFLNDPHPELAGHRLGGGIGEILLPAILIPAGEKAVITTIAFGDIHDHSIFSQFVRTSHLVISTVLISKTGSPQSREERKGYHFGLSGERPESPKLKHSGQPNFFRRRPFFPCRPLTGKGKDVSSATFAPGLLLSSIFLECF